MLDWRYLALTLLLLYLGCLNFLAEGDDGLKAALSFGVEDVSVSVTDIGKFLGRSTVAQRMVARI